MFTVRASIMANASPRRIILALMPYKAMNVFI